MATNEQVNSTTMSMQLSSSVNPQAYPLNDGGTYHFVVVPKLINEPFMDAAGQGCMDRSKELGSVTCHYIGHPTADAEQQAAVITRLAFDPSSYNLSKVDGMAVAVLDERITGAAIDAAVAAGIPVITWDADAPESNRLAFISTDNYAFGQQLGKVLEQLRPAGGKFGMITGFGPNLIDRVRGVRDRLQHTKWMEVQGSPLNCESNISKSLEQMYQYAQETEVDAIVPVGGWPMFDNNSTPWKVFSTTYRHRITTVVADSVDIQLTLMTEGFVDGLVGQLPYQMGQASAEVLLQVNHGTLPQTQIYGTHLLEILRHPLVLPEVEVNQHYLGSLVALGYTLLAIMGGVGFLCLHWTRVNRQSRVVRVSQPLFMSMICFGSLLLASAIIPLSMDDERYSQRSNDIACMSIPWCIVLGFATAFSALSSKTKRVVRILHNAQRFERIQVHAHDVIKPYAALMVVNIIVLVCWTVLSPLRYERRSHLGTDDWNRIISTYGNCESEGSSSTPYLTLLSLINIGLLLVANIQAYRARSIHTEFSESRYVAIVMASMLQTFLIGVPMLFLVYEQPEVYYVVMSFLIFVTCMAIQLFMFVPKIILLRQWEARKKAAGNTATSTASEAGMKVVHMGSSVLVPHLQQRTPGAAPPHLPPRQQQHRVQVQLSPRHAQNQSSPSQYYPQSQQAQQFQFANMSSNQESASRYSIPYMDSCREPSQTLASSCNVNQRSIPPMPFYRAAQLATPISAEEVAMELMSMMKDLSPDAKHVLAHKLGEELALREQFIEDEDDFHIASTPPLDLLPVGATAAASIANTTTTTLAAADLDVTVDYVDDDPAGDKSSPLSSPDVSTVSSNEGEDQE